MNLQLNCFFKKITLSVFIFVVAGSASASNITSLRNIRLIEKDYSVGESWVAYYFSKKEPGVPQIGYSSNESCQIHATAPIHIQYFPAGDYLTTEDKVDKPDFWDNSWRRRVAYEDRSKKVGISIFCKARSFLNPLSNKYINTILVGHFMIK
jgi:hypothetical protein